MANSLQQANEPTLASLLRLHKQDVMLSINCHQVGEIVSFDPSTQTAEVQIKMLRMMNGELKQYPVLVDCPCVVLTGGNGCLTLPIQAGDSCLVLFNDKDLDNWYAGGQTVAPRKERSHDFADAIALVGIRNKQNQIEDYLQHGVELKYGQSTIKLENNKVTITDHKDTIVMDNGNIDIKGNVNIVQNTVDKNSLHSYVIDSYKNGESWYRLYSDKWIEQGGYSAAIGDYQRTPVSFHKQFSDTNFDLQVTSIWQGTNDDGSWMQAWKIEQNSLTAAGFSIYNRSATPKRFKWVARGYIA